MAAKTQPATRKNTVADTITERWNDLSQMAEQLAQSMQTAGSHSSAQALTPLEDRDIVVAAQRAVDSIREVSRLLSRPDMPEHPNTPYVDDVSDALRRAVRNRLVHLGQTGAAVEDLGDPQEVAERWASMLPVDTSPIAELTGPFYGTSGLTKWLNITRQALDSRARNRTILALSSGSGQRVYPAWQFTSDRQTIPHLSEVLHALAAGQPDPWTHALWLTGPVDNGDGEPKPAWQWLAEGNDPDPVLAEARADAARWAA